MENRITDKIKALQNGTTSQEEFMKKLAELDEKGHLSQDLLDQVNGGASITKPTLIDTPVLGIWFPTSIDPTV